MRESREKEIRSLSLLLTDLLEEIDYLRSELDECKNHTLESAARIADERIKVHHDHRAEEAQVIASLIRKRIK